MSMELMIDASTPPFPVPYVYCIAGYIGGNTPYVWTPDDWADQPSQNRLPIFTASDREDTDAAAAMDAGTILRLLAALNVPHGTTFALDIEDRIYTNYLRTLNAHITTYRLMKYGGTDTILSNPSTSGGTWGAHWTGNIADAIRGLVSTVFHAFQWADDRMLGLPYDISLISSGVPLWHV